MKVSIIMPVYNSEKYLDTSIGSVLKQSYEDFELILVNDGSKDSSGEICDRYALTDKRIKVIHKENQGLSAARNTGIQQAKGEFITFIDNDDEYTENLLLDNIPLMEENNLDILRFSRKRITYVSETNIQEDIFGTKGIVDKNQFAIMEKSEINKDFQKIKNAGALYGIWNAIFKLSII
ncbi:glycosyltransferase, partial [Breznakia sp. OttesenSCG-928-G09]|nr:glycosyltransferase [Breznakia sp. OttesenSCG-928-G09]